MRSDDALTPDLPSVELENLHKWYGSVEAVKGVSFACQDGEFLTVLGPSGSGKTTVLRMIAGFEQPTQATRLAINGISVLNVPAYKRDVSTVFQQYALFPHMTVGENVEYSLKVRGVDREERRRQAASMLELVRLGHTYPRRTNQLSGGEQQRVALARALVSRPKVLLLDEPLGALDEKLRRDMQIELKQIQRSVGTSFVYVTHDQQEALSMSDRIVGMNHGKIEQIGAAEEVYEFPTTRFVADFLGASNLFEGSIVDVRSDFLQVETPIGLFHAPKPAGDSGSAADTPPLPGQAVSISVRPDRLTLVGDPQHLSAGAAPQANGLDIPHNAVEGTAETIVYRGEHSDVIVRLHDGSHLRAGMAAGQHTVAAGDQVVVRWPAAATRVLR